MNARTMILGILIFVIAVCARAVAVPGPAPVHVLKVTGEIEPAVARYIERGIERAESDGAGAVVIQLDTPGGLSDSMRQIISKMLNTSVPVIVYVAPNGARAASAGAFITIAANVAAMAPVTNIGSSHPVSISPIPTGGGEQPKGALDTMTQKVENDAAQYIISIAEKRGRNAKWAETAVRKSANVTAAEAVKLHVVDFIALDMRDLLAKSDGRVVETATGKVTLHTKGAPVQEFPMSWQLVGLQYLANPLIAFFLMLAAMYGIIFEINNPGAIAPGVIGIIALILLLYSFSVIPINAAGLLLVIVAIGLFIADIKVPTHGALTAGGIIAFFVGSMMVFGSGGPGVAAPAGAIAAGTLATAVFFAFLVGMGARALKLPVVTGRQGLVGRVVVARTDIAPTGKIFTEGAWWNAETDGGPIKKGEKVKIVGMEGLKVKVEKE